MRHLILCLIVAASTGTALAAPTKARVPEEVRGLDSSDPAEVRESLESLGMQGTEVAGRAITARLERGLDKELTLIALDALGILQHTPAGPLLAKLARHRDAEVRLRALQTLLAIEARETREALEKGLDDLSPPVRREAARGLAKFGDAKSLPVLFRALDAGQFEAATAIAVLGDEVAVRRLVTYLGRVPFVTMTDAMHRVLTRAGLDRRLRLDVVGRLVELATPEVKYFLEDIGPDLPGGANDPVKRAVADAAFRIVD